MDITLQPAYRLTFIELAALFNEAFAGYVGGDVHFTAETLASWVAHENVDLTLSQVFMRGNQAVGFGDIVRQGGASRLAAFGIVPSAAYQGIGKAAMLQLIEQAKQRGDSAFWLEVIEQNPRAVRLYQGVGFEIAQRLIGCKAVNPPGAASTALQSVDLYEAAQTVVAYGARDLPWQVSGTALLRLSPPNAAYRLAQATAILSDPSAATIAIHALIVTPEARRQGQASRLLSALFARFPFKTWVVTPIFPEAYVQPLADRFAFDPQPISQFQMRLRL